MANTLYDSIVKKGEDWGEAQGELAGSARAKAETIIRILIHRMGWVDPAVRDRIREISGSKTLATCYDEVLLVSDAQDARRLVDKIQKAPRSERDLASVLYDSILQGETHDEARAEARGEAHCKAATIIRILIHRMGWVDPAIRERIRGLSDSDTLTSWYEDAVRIIDAEDARRLVDKIRNTPA